MLIHTCPPNSILKGMNNSSTQLAPCEEFDDPVAGRCGGAKTKVPQSTPTAGLGWGAYFRGLLDGQG